MSILSRLVNLKFLDDLPVDQEERRLVAAWKDGGIEKEREEKEKIRNEKIDWHK